MGERADEVTFHLPDRDGQRALWTRALSHWLDEPSSQRVTEDLVRRYQLSPGAINSAVASVVECDPHPGRRRKGAHLSTATLTDAIQRRLDHRLGWLADACPVELTLDDLVLEPRAREQLSEVLHFARHADQVFNTWGLRRLSPSGQGLSVMFMGPPSTGKTLAAGVLASALGRTLYRVDLSRIVDKYIGETEKNLGRVFDEAERAQAILLFDEADSLFAQRTSVKSSNDRYANLEVNFLLQRLDAFSGVSILTTSFAQSIDDAHLEARWVPPTYLSLNTCLSAAPPRRRW